MPARIDDSHAPFKRTTRIGPGPKKRPQVARTKDWECQKPKGKKYVQVCTYVGDIAKKRGKKRTIKTAAAKKKKYNKLYRKWLLAKGGPSTKKALPSYKCKKTPVAKCK